MGFELKRSAIDGGNKHRRRLPPADYLRWVEDSQNGLIIKATNGALDFTVQFKPLDYIVLKEAKLHNHALNKKALGVRKAEIDGLEYYSFFISLNNGKKDIERTLSGDKDEYDKVIRYFAGDMQHDLTLVAGADTLDCKLFHFERTYGVTNYSRFEIGFNPANKSLDRTIVFKADAINAGTIELRINSTNLQNIPQVNF